MKLQNTPSSVEKSAARTMVLVATFSVFGLGVLSACTERPQDGFDELLQAIHAGDADKAWARFDQDSQRMMEDRAYAINNGIGLGDLADGKSARDHLMNGFLPRGIESIDVSERQGDKASLIVTDFEGKTQKVQMRFENGAWRLHLPGASPAE